MSGPVEGRGKLGGWGAVSKPAPRPPAAPRTLSHSTFAPSPGGECPLDCRADPARAGHDGGGVASWTHHVGADRAPRLDRAGTDGAGTRAPPPRGRVAGHAGPRRLPTVVVGSVVRHRTGTHRAPPSQPAPHFLHPNPRGAGGVDWAGRAAAALGRGPVRRAAAQCGCRGGLARSALRPGGAAQRRRRQH